MVTSSISYSHRGKRPTGKSILAKLQNTGVNTFRVTRHKDGSYSAGFIRPANGSKSVAHVHEHALSIARKNAYRMAQVLGYRIITFGNDIAPGYKTLSFGGATTPIIHFYIPAKRPIRRKYPAKIIIHELSPRRVFPLLLPAPPLMLMLPATI